MNSRMFVSCVLLLLLAGCGPSPEQVATMTAAAWTPTPPPTATPPPTPTETPVPYDLTARVMDENGAPIENADIFFAESGSENAFKTDAQGKFSWSNLPGPDATLKVLAQGYLPGEQAGTLQRGSNELTVPMKRDPKGLLAADACAPDEQLLYIEDFQDGKAQGWQNITAAAEFNAQNGWAIANTGDDNKAASFSGVHENLDDLQGQTFDNVVWRLRVATTGTDGFSFLDLRRAPKEGGETRYPIQWGATPNLALTRLEMPGAGHFPVSTSQLRMKQGQWYYLEISFHQGLIQIWVDGTKIIEWQDPQPLPPGSISLEAHIPSDPNTVYLFDDISVCDLQAPFATSLYKPPVQ
jgi:Carboxypeptidase regulatory-like domain/3-keto-disaccharide hydrolase